MPIQVQKPKGFIPWYKQRFKKPVDNQTEPNFRTKNNGEALHFHTFVHFVPFWTHTYSPDYKGLP